LRDGLLKGRKGELEEKKNWKVSEDAEPSGWREVST